MVWTARAFLGLGTALLVLACAGCGAPTEFAGPAAPSPSGQESVGSRAGGDAASLVLHDGDRVHASGRVVAVAGRPVRFCAPVAVAAVGYAAGHEPAPAYCDWGVDVQGVNLNALSSRRAKAGAVEGYADLVGTYRASGVVEVVTQRPYRVTDFPLPPDRPPCPAPPGGWPTGAADENLDLTPIEDYGREHPDVVLTPAQLRPSSRQVLAYVLTLTDPGPVDVALRPAYGGRLCVVRSRYSRGQISRATQAFTSRTDGGHADIYAVGAGALAADGQPVIEVECVQVNPELVAVAAEQPRGLVRLRPWLQPG